MKQRYNEVMEHIVVTDEMRARILAAVQQADLTPRKKAIRFDRILKMAAAAAACAAVVVMGQNAMPKMGSAAPADTGAYTDRAEKASDSCEMAMQAVNGIQECPDALGLEQAVGFAVPQLESLPYTLEETVYRSYWGEMAEVEYLCAGGEEVCLRKAPGEGPVSGDYNDYTYVQQLAVNEVQAVLKGSAESTYTLAEWQADGYAYSLSLSSPQTAAWWENAIQTIH